MITTVHNVEIKKVAKDAVTIKREALPSRKFLVQAALAYYGVKFFVPIHMIEPGEVAAVATAEHHIERAFDAAPQTYRYVKVRIAILIRKVK